MADHDYRAYVRKADEIRAQILDGQLKPGNLVPSIATIQRESGYSRHTIGRALHLLEDKGLIIRVPGHGYYVE
jgi:DNA-binding GntR family transcriptional regulator